MTTLNFHNFGQFEILGMGMLKPLANDGRSEFLACASLEQGLEADGWQNTPRAALDHGYRFGFVIMDKNCAAGGSYGHIVGNDLGNALEEHFRALSENGLEIAETVG